MEVIETQRLGAANIVAAIIIVVALAAVSAYRAIARQVAPWQAEAKKVERRTAALSKLTEVTEEYTRGLTEVLAARHNSLDDDERDESIAHRAQQLIEQLNEILPPPKETPEDGEAPVTGSRKQESRCRDSTGLRQRKVKK